MTYWTAGFAVIALASLLLMGCGGNAGSTGGSGGEPNAECNGDGDCSDGKECTAGSCSEGACAYTNLADGTPCTLGECSAGLCSATGPSGCAAEASATFADGDFADGDWTYAAIDGVSQGIRMIDSVTTVQSGGNPGAYQRVEVTLTATTEQAASLWVAHADRSRRPMSRAPRLPLPTTSASRSSRRRPEPLLCGARSSICKDRSLGRPSKPHEQRDAHGHVEPETKGRIPTRYEARMTARVKRDVPEHVQEPAYSDERRKSGCADPGDEPVARQAA